MKSEHRVWQTEKAILLARKMIAIIIIHPRNGFYFEGDRQQNYVYELVMNLLSVSFSFHTH